MTRPIPMWLAFGQRIDSTPIDDPAETLRRGEKEMFITFTMSEKSAINMAGSVNDELYQPLHEEGNLFSYPPSVSDTEASSDMQHIEKTVTPSTFTSS